MTQIKATGILRHFFWSNYHAGIALKFSDKNAAISALTKLSDKWKVSDIENILTCTVNSNDLKTIIIPELVKFGAEEKKIDSISKSIDHGELFNIVIDIIPTEQLNLF